MKSYFVMAGMLLVIVSASADGVYRWVDQSGKVHYGDVPTEESAQVEQKKFSASPAIDGNWPYETRHARENFPVVLYVSENCTDICKDARELLNKRGIPYAEKTLTTKQEIADFKTQSGGGIVPAISVGSSWTKGFQADAWNRELDMAGYPKFSPYHPPSVQASQPAKEPKTERPPAVEESNVESPAASAPAVDQ